MNTRSTSSPYELVDEIMMNRAITRQRRTHPKRSDVSMYDVRSYA